MGRLDGKVALVTGSGQGIGQGVALALAKDGASLAIVGRTESKLLDTVNLIKQAGGIAHAITTDVTEPDQVKACVAETAGHFGRLDILVNNAQAYEKATLLECTDEMLYDAFNSGAMATFRFMRASHPHLKDARGVVVNMGSGATLLHDGGPMRFGAYLVSKFAIQGISRQAAVEWGPDGIRVYQVMPAAWTPMTRMSQKVNPEALQRMIDTIPMGRMGDPEMDIGRPICWLCTDEASYMTGTTIQLDGGQLFQQ